jgi:uncharacterized Zn finger protein
MTREALDAKARRYLGEGRLVVTHVLGDDVTATCRGQGEIYQLGHDLKRGWWCTCAARRICAHLIALMSVTIRRQGAEQATGPSLRRAG